MSERYMTQEQLQKENDKVRGCMAALCIMMLVAMTGGIVWVIKDICKNNKAHPNVISYINQADKKIIIYDIKTKEERLLDYSKISNTRSFEQYKKVLDYSKAGDTVAFVSPKYDERRVFDIDIYNRFYINNDSVIARIKAEKLKQQVDSLIKVKQKIR